MCRVSYTATEARHGGATPRLRHAVAVTRRAMHPSRACPLLQGATGGKQASRSGASDSRPGARPAAAARHRNRGHRRCRSVDPRPCCRHRGGRRTGHGLASTPWHQAVCRHDLRSGSHGYRGSAHGRHGGRDRSFGHRRACFRKFACWIVRSLHNGRPFIHL
jgi:hypothetical protein